MPWPLAGLNQSLHLCSLGENFMGRERETDVRREQEERVMGKKSTICAAIRSFIHVKWRCVSDTGHGKLQWQDPTRAIQRLPVTALSVPSHDKSDTDSLLTQWGVERIDAGCAAAVYLTPNSCNKDLRYILEAMTRFSLLRWAEYSFWERQIMSQLLSFYSLRAERQCGYH